MIAKTNITTLLICTTIVLFWLLITYRLEHLWLKSVFLHFPNCWKQASAATSASKQNQNKNAADVRVSTYPILGTSKPNCDPLVFYLVPKVSCSVPAVKDTVHCGSTLFHGCRKGHFGCRRQSDRRRRSQYSTLLGHSLLPVVGRRCLLVSAAERRETQMAMYRLPKYIHSHNRPDGTDSQSDSVWLYGNTISISVTSRIKRRHREYYLLGSCGSTLPRRTGLLH